MIFELAIASMGPRATGTGVPFGATGGVPRSGCRIRSPGGANVTNATDSKAGDIVRRALGVMVILCSGGFASATAQEPLAPCGRNAGSASSWNRTIRTPSIPRRESPSSWRRRSSTRGSRSRCHFGSTTSSSSSSPPPWPSGIPAARGCRCCSWSTFPPLAATKRIGMAGTPAGQEGCPPACTSFRCGWTIAALPPCAGCS